MPGIRRFRAAHLIKATSLRIGFVNFLMPVVLLFTVLASVSFGVVAAYAAIFAILSTFGRAAQQEPPRPRLVLVPSQSQAQALGD